MNLGVTVLYVDLLAFIVQTPRKSRVHLCFDLLIIQ